MHIQQSSYQSLMLLWFVATQLWCCCTLALAKDAHIEA